MYGVRSLYNLFKAYRGKRAAVRLLAPFIDRSLWQTGAVSPATWVKAYVVGYVTTLITVTSQDAVDGLEGNTLGLVQLEAWGQLTGLPSDLIGERILSFSLTDDADFAAGCRDGLTFARALLSKSSARVPVSLFPSTGPVREISGAFSAIEEELATLWNNSIGLRLEAP